MTLYDTKRSAAATTTVSVASKRHALQELEHLLMRSYIPVNDHYDYNRLTKRYREVKPEEPTRSAICVPLALFPVLPLNTLLTKCRIGVEVEIAEATEFMSTHTLRHVSGQSTGVEEPKYLMTCKPNSVKLYVHTCSLDRGMKETLEPIRRLHRILHSNVKPGFYHVTIKGSSSSNAVASGGGGGGQQSVTPIYLKRINLCKYSDLFGALKTTHDGDSGSSKGEEKAYLMVAIRAEKIYEKFQYSDVYAVHLKWENDTTSTLPRKIATTTPDTIAPASGGGGGGGFITFKQDPPKDDGAGNSGGGGDGRMVALILGTDETTRKKSLKSIYQTYRKITGLSPTKQLKENYFTKSPSVCLFNFEISKPPVDMNFAGVPVGTQRQLGYHNRLQEDPHLIMQLQFAKPLNKNINICAMTLNYELTFVDEDGIIVRM